MMNNTLTQLRDLKLAGFALALEEQLSIAGSTSLSFEERLALLVDREVHYRDDRKRVLLLKKARLKYAQACIEDVDARPGRGIDRAALMSLALSRWIEEGTTVLISGPTGTGKSWLACALAQYACRRGQSALYLRVPRLAEELRILHGNGGFARWLQALAPQRSPDLTHPRSLGADPASAQLFGWNAPRASSRERIPAAGDASGGGRKA